MSHEHPAIILDSLNLETAERRLCEEALFRAGSIVEAAKLLGITRHALRRRIEKLGLEWPRGGRGGTVVSTSAP